MNISTATAGSKGATRHHLKAIAPVLRLSDYRKPEQKGSQVWSRIADNGALTFDFSPEEMSPADTLRHLMAMHALMGKMIRSVQETAQRSAPGVSHG